MTDTLASRTTTSVKRITAPPKKGRKMVIKIDKAKRVTNELVEKFSFHCGSSHTGTTSLNKYFELKNLWGCRPNSNYVLAVVIRKSGPDNMSKQCNHMQNV